MLGEIAPRVPEGRIISGPSEPPLKSLVDLRETEVIDQIADAQDPPARIIRATRSSASPFQKSGR